MPNVHFRQDLSFAMSNPVVSNQSEAATQRPTQEDHFGRYRRPDPALVERPLHCLNLKLVGCLLDSGGAPVRWHPIVRLSFLLSRVTETD